MEIGGIVLILELFGFLVGVPLTYILIKRFSKEIKTTDTIVINRDGGRCGRNVIGSLISNEPGKNGRPTIKYLSRDSDKPETIEVVAESNKVIVYPKGMWSKDKSIIEILPNNAQDFINNLLIDIEKKNAESHIVMAQREGINRQQTHLQDMGEGEISATNLGLAHEFLGNVLKSPNKDETQKKSGSFQAGMDTFRS